MTTSRVCFVIPTYNEAQNITPLLEQLTALHPHPETLFLIVDDSSPDGTARLVKQFAITDPRVHLLTGPRRGLGDAYLRGITHALDNLNAEVIIQMDADFSHNPIDAARLIEALTNGEDEADDPGATRGRSEADDPNSTRGRSEADNSSGIQDPSEAKISSRAGQVDVAIGSRYVKSGTLDERWGMGRRLLSRWGNRLARWIAGIGGIQDCTAGFKAIRATALQAANISKIGGQGYVFQVELLHRLIRSGAKVVEIPIHFREREHGATKLGFKSLLEFFFVVWRLRFARYKTFAKFALTGLSGVIVNLSVFQLLLEAGIYRLLASALAIEVSVITNFLLNNYWTFADRVMTGRKRIRGLKFNLISLLALGLGVTTFWLLTILFPHTPPVLLQACAIVPGTLVNYALNSRWTFVDRSDSTQNQ